MSIYVWNEIVDKNSTPICSHEEAVQFCKGNISLAKCGIVDVDLKKANYFVDKISSKLTVRRKKIILSLGKKKEIDKFILLHNLTKKKDFIYHVIALLNNEVSSTIQIMQSNKELLRSLKNTKKPESDLQKVIKKYVDRYIPSGSTIPKSEINSISFKFSNPTETISITNFFIVGAIMDVLRMHYDFDTPIGLNLNAETLVFKKKIASDLFLLFVSNKEWGTSNKSEVHRKIKFLFDLADVDATTEIIKKWTS